MESLKLLHFREQAQECLKYFKERTMTKKNASENILLNSSFNTILNTLLSDSTECVVEEALNFIIIILKEKLISIPAFIALIQQKLPKINVPKAQSIHQLARISHLIIKIDHETGLDVSFHLASHDSRSIPFLLDELIVGSSERHFAFYNFLLGDPDLALSLSLSDDFHYKLSRCLLLASIVQSIDEDECVLLLITFLTWNSGKLCIQEFAYLTPLIRYFSRCDTLSLNHMNLFSFYFEALCSLFFKYGAYAELIEDICANCSSLINAYLAFMLGSLLLLCKNVNSKTATGILGVMCNYSTLNSISKVACAHLIMKIKITDELLICMQKIFIYIPSSIGEKSVESDTTPLTEFGLIVDLGYCRTRPRVSEYNYFFDLLDISDSMSNNFRGGEKLPSKNNFELLFTLLSYQWRVEFDREHVVELFLSLLNPFEEDTVDEKIFRYSWIVDFFESNFTDEMYLLYLPLLCKHVTCTDNVLFAFVQKKISFYMSRRNDVTVQLPCVLSLNFLFESSQSRQSRLGFLSTMTLSFLQTSFSLVNTLLDTRAILLSFELLTKLCDISVIDPRDIWTKYVEEKLFVNQVLFGSSHIRCGIFKFTSTLRFIPEGLNDEINEVKFCVIKGLIEYLIKEKDLCVLDFICSSLANFNPDIIKRVELELDRSYSSSAESKNTLTEEQTKAESIIFNPALLFNVSKRYNAIPSKKYLRFWTWLINFEVSSMSRTLFLGSNSSVRPKIDKTIKAIESPLFCNPLILEEFDGIDIKDIDDMIKFIKTRFIPLIPSVGSLAWYIRPHCPKFLLEAVDRLIYKTDDQRIRLQLSDFDFLLKHLKSGSTPQSLCSLILCISSILKSLFMAQNISVSLLRGGWIRTLTNLFSDNSEFKIINENDDFLASCAVASNILTGCSTEIDESLAKFLFDRIIDNSKVKDGVAVFCSIEALSHLSTERLYAIFNDSTCSSKRRLVALLSLRRLGREVSLNESFIDTDNLLTVIKLIVTKSSLLEPSKGLSDPIDFKGLCAYTESIVAPSELIEKCKKRAFDCGNVPASLKFDSIFSFLLGSGFDLLTLTFNAANQVDFKALESSTKDPKSLAFLQLVLRNQNTDSELKVDCKGLERFGEYSWLKYIGSIDDEFIKFGILTGCKLLPRINWNSVGFNHFDFVLKHVLSITPVTDIPYVNPSLSDSFFENVIDFISLNFSQSNILRICEVIFSLSAERSSQILAKLFDYCVRKCNSENVSILKLLITEIVSHPIEFAKCINYNSLKHAENSVKVKLSEEIISLSHHLSQSSIIFGVLPSVGKSVFELFEEVFNYPDRNFQHELIDFLIIKIEVLDSKSRIQSLIDVLDLLFVYQRDVFEFETLNNVLQSIFSTCLMLECRSVLSDPVIVDKIKSRSSLIPTNISDCLGILLSSIEFDKKGF